MKKITLFLAVLLMSICTCAGQVKCKYKPIVKAGINLSYSESYAEEFRNSGLLGYSVKVENGLDFQYSSNAAFFAGVGIGLDYAKKNSDVFVEDEIEYYYKHNSVSLPLYLTLSLNWNRTSTSTIFKVNGGYYRWVKSHEDVIVIDDDCVNKVSSKGSLVMEHPDNLFLGFEFGFRFPISNKQGMSLMIEYTCIGAGSKVHNHKNCKHDKYDAKNNRIGLNIAFDF